MTLFAAGQRPPRVLGAGQHSAFASHWCPGASGRVSPAVGDSRLQQGRQSRVAACAEGVEGGGARAARHLDPWAAAGTRLENLLSGVGDGEDEMLDRLLEETGTGTKLALSAAVAGLVIAGAAFVCSLSHQDIAGGASASVHSLKAAQFGFFGAAPLVAVRLYLWSDQGRASHPALDSYCSGRAEEVSPLLLNMAAWQVGLMVVMDAVPEVLMQLPACLGTLASLADEHSPQLARAAGLSAGGHLPGGLGPTAALGLVAAVAWAVPALSARVEDDESAVVSSAVENSERYYRTMATPGGLAPEEAARAFQAVAAAWRHQRVSRGQVEGALAAGQITLLALLWFATGNLAAPLAAALAGTAVEYGRLWVHLHAPSRAR